MCKKRISPVLLKKMASVFLFQILNLKKTDKNHGFFTKNVTKTFMNSSIDR